MPENTGVDPKVMDKVRKLLALGEEGRGATEAERDLAMERAQHLMMKFNLDLAAIETAGEGGVKGDVDQEKGLNTTRRSEWEGRLLTCIAHYNLCRTYFIPSGQGGRKTKSWFVVGRKHNVEFVRELHQFVVDQLKTQCRTALRDARYNNPEAVRNPNSFRRAFFEGADRAVGARLAQQQRSRMVDTGSKGQELVRSESADIEQFLQSLFGGNLKRTPPRRGSRNVHGQAAGAEAGRNADLFPGRKLGGGS